MVMRLIVEPIVRAALLEDLGRAGDITTDAIVPPDAAVAAVIAARQPGIVAGLDAALLAFELVDPGVRIERLCADGARVARGETVARINGRARSVLAVERTALNLLCRMSGVATATRALADAIAGSTARIVCTRKTTPGLRTLEKEAVRLGGGAIGPTEGPRGRQRGSIRRLLAQCNVGNRFRERGGGRLHGRAQIRVGEFRAAVVGQRDLVRVDRGPPLDDMNQGQHVPRLAGRCGRPPSSARA